MSGLGKNPWFLTILNGSTEALGIYFWGLAKVNYITVARFVAVARADIYERDTGVLPL